MIYVFMKNGWKEFVKVYIKNLSGYIYLKRDSRGSDGCKTMNLIFVFVFVF
jgi:hypothetical protein